MHARHDDAGRGAVGTVVKNGGGGGGGDGGGVAIGAWRCRAGHKQAALAVMGRRCGGRQLACAGSQDLSDVFDNIIVMCLQKP